MFTKVLAEALEPLRLKGIARWGGGESEEPRKGSSLDLSNIQAFNRQKCMGMGAMVQSGGQEIFELEGAESDSPESPSLPVVLRSPCISAVTQHDRCALLDKTGRKKEKGTYGVGASDPILGRTQSSVTSGNSPERYQELPSGLPQQKQSKGVRMVVEPENISDDYQELGAISGRFICEPRERKDACLLFAPKRIKH